MALQADDVRKIAHLARLAVSEEDIDGYAKDLSNILALVEQMNTVNTEGVVPLANPMDAVQRLREDVVTETNLRDSYQAGAPATEDGLYLVPQVIE